MAEQLNKLYKTQIQVHKQGLYYYHTVHRIFMMKNTKLLTESVAHG